MIMDGGVDPTSWSYQFGGLLFTVGLVVVGLLLFKSGWHQKRWTDRKGGEGKLAAGVIVALVGVMSALVTYLPSSSTPNAALNDDLQTARAFIEAHDLTIHGTAEAGPLTTEITARYVGSDAEGSITILGMDYAFRRIGSSAYVLYTTPILKAALEAVGDDTDLTEAEVAEVIKVGAGTWANTEDEAPQVAKAIQKFSHRGWILAVIPDSGLFRKGRSKTIHGVDCFGITPADGEGILYVSRTDGRPMQLVAPSSDALDLNWADLEPPAEPRGDQLYKNAIEKAGFTYKE